MFETVAGKPRDVDVELARLRFDHQDPASGGGHHPLVEKVDDLAEGSLVEQRYPS
jgi:hypothetical protein